MTVTVPCLFCDTLNRVALDKLDQGPRCGQCRRPILLDRPVKVGDASFARVIQDTEVPVVVDFYADWCGPCKAMAPVFDAFAAEQEGKALVAKLDTDRNPVTSQQYEVRSIPTLIVFAHGKEAARQVGLVPKATLEALLRQAA